MSTSKRTAKAKKLIPLQIDRKRWGSGGLLVAGGKMCCLGFACKKMGISPKHLRDNGMPSDLVSGGVSKERLSNFLTRGGNYDLDAAEEAARINDDPCTESSEKEQLLKPVLAKLGFAVKFIDRIK